MHKKANVRIPLPADGRSPENGRSAGKRKHETRRVLNLPLLIGTLVAVAVLGPAVYFWHWYQVGHIGGAFLERANVLEKEEEWRSAASYLYRYLRLHPDNMDVQIQLAETFDRSVETPRQKARAIGLYYRALGVAPADRKTDLRRRLAELLLEMRRSTEAESEARKLLAVNDSDPQGQRLLALSLYQQFRSGTLAARHRDSSVVGKAFQDALELNPGDIELAVIMARIYREEEQLLSDEQRNLKKEERNQKADEAIDQMVAKNPENAEALLARYRYYSPHDSPQAEKDLEEALKYGSDEINVLLSAAGDARRKASQCQKDSGPPDEIKKHYADARKFYQQAIELESSDERPYIGLGEVCLLQGQRDLAIETWRQGLKNANGQSIELHLRLAEALISQGQLNEAQAALGVLLRAINKFGPRLSKNQRLLLKRSHDLLQAKWYLKKGDVLRAVPLLRQAAAGRPNSQFEARQNLQACMMLGSAYSVLRQWDQAATAFERAAAFNTELLQPRLAAAEAWANGGQPEMAVPYYEQALEIEDSPGIRLALARARLQRQIRLPNKERAWVRFDEDLKKLKQVKDTQNPESQGAFPNAWRVTLLEGDYVLARSEEQGERESGVRKVMALLQESEKEYPDAPALWHRLVMAYQKLGHSADADRALKKFEEIAQNRTAGRLARVRLYSQRKQYGKAREVLLAELASPSLTPQVQSLLRFELAQLDGVGGDLKESRRQLLKLYNKNPSSIGLVRELAEYAFAMRDVKDAERWEQKLRQLEGTHSSTWQYYKARRLLLQAASLKDPRFFEAAKLQVDIVGERPKWPSAHLLKALVEERRGNTEEAIAAYQTAIRLGDTRVATYERLVRLLLRERRLDDAQRYLSQLDKHIPLSGSLTALAIAVAQEQKEMDRAVEIARRTVQQCPDDAWSRVQLGQAMAAAGQVEQAEAEYLRATQLAPDLPESWNALFEYYVRTRKPEKAQEALQKLAENNQLSESQRLFILGQGYELLGDPKEAEAKYRAAKRLAPKNLAIYSRLGTLLRRIDLGKAEEVCREMLRLASDSETARRQLAEILTARGGEKRIDEALRLLDPTKFKDDRHGLGRRRRAWLLCRRGGKENLLEARVIYEDLVASPETCAETDRVALAKLYEHEGRYQRAKDQLLELVTKEKPSTSYLQLYVEFLLRHNHLGEVKEWMTKLDKAEPDSLLSVALLAKWMHGSGQASQIDSVVDASTKKIEQRLEKNEEKAGLYLAAGNIYSSVGQHEAAEQWYRKLDKLMPGKAYGPLAMSIARQGRTTDAIRICIAAADSDDSPLPAIALASVLAAGRSTEDDLKLAEPLLVKVAEKHADNVDLLFALANIHIRREQTKDAIKRYEQVLALNPKHVFALNNLATLLSEESAKCGEALKYIDQAIEIAGEQAPLLDTKGMILVYDQKAEQAVYFLKTAAAALNPDPRYYFHLAVAYQRTGAADEARQALKKAQDGNLDDVILTPADRQLLKELEQKLR